MRVETQASFTRRQAALPAVMSGSSFLNAIKTWATSFPDRKGEHFVFASEKYGLAEDEARPHVHSTDPTKPLTSLKEAWESAQERSGVICRHAAHQLPPRGNRWNARLPHRAPVRPGFEVGRIACREFAPLVQIDDARTIRRCRRELRRDALHEGRL
jgi:hypothetical protein